MEFKQAKLYELGNKNELNKREMAVATEENGRKGGGGNERKVCNIV